MGISPRPVAWGESVRVSVSTRGLFQEDTCVQSCHQAEPARRLTMKGIGDFGYPWCDPLAQLFLGGDVDGPTESARYPVEPRPNQVKP